MKTKYILIGAVALLFSSSVYADDCGEGKYLNLQENKCKSFMEKADGVISEITCEGNLSFSGICDKQLLHISLDNGKKIDSLVNDSSFKIGDIIEIIVEK